MLISIILLSISLSIDAFGIGASYGLRNISIPPVTKIIISIQSILLTGFSLMCGKWLNNIFPEYISKNLGVVILIFMGTWILWQGINEDKKSAIKKSDGTILSLIIKSMGITIQIVRNPQYCDMNKSMIIEPMEALYLGFALSIDSLGAGLGSGAAGISSPVIPFLVALCQILFLTSGHQLGKKLKLLSNIKENVWVILSGVLLIIIGVLRML